MKKKKVVLLGGLVLVLALGVYAIAWAALNVGSDLNMTPPGKGPFEILKLKVPSASDSAATWGYVKDAVGGLDPGSVDEIGIWRQNSDTNPDIYLSSDVGLKILSGNVGIGTNDPSAKLHIYNTVDSASIKFQSKNVAGEAWSIYNYNSGDINNLSFYSHVTSDIRNPNIIVLSADGRIGIGTTAPRQHLSIGTYLDIYDGAIDNNLIYPSIRSSIENLMINGPDIYGGVYFNYDRGQGVKFFAHPSPLEVEEIAALNDNGDLRLNGTLSVDGSFLGIRKSYIRGKLGVGNISNPHASLEINAVGGVVGGDDIFRTTYYTSGDYVTAYLRPDGDTTTKEFESVYPISPVTHFDKVDDNTASPPLHDSDATYIQSKIGERGVATDLFNIKDLTGDVSSIDYVKVTAVCKIGDNPNPAFVSPVLRVGGTGQIYTNETFTELNENYQTITFIANQDPNGGDWTENNITNLQIGVQARGGPVPPAGPPQNIESFISGTQILMANGSYENIEKIKAGDKVVSYDLDKKLFIDNEVITTTNGHKEYLLINEKLGITLNQKVYIADKGFIQAKEVRIGDYLLNESKENIRINSIKNFPKKVDVYDLVLKSPHNFFAEGHLVHNVSLAATIASGVRCTQVYATVGYYQLEPKTALVVDELGNVGIGTNDPQYLLDLQGTGIQYLQIKSTSTTGGRGAGILLGDAQGGEHWQIYSTGTGTQKPLDFLYCADQGCRDWKIRFTQGGRMGIGTAEPSLGKLQVHSGNIALSPIGSYYVTGLATAGSINTDYAANIAYVNAAVDVAEWTHSIQIAGDGTETCDVSNAGRMRYYETKDTSYFQVCMQTSNGIYGWYTIKSYGIL